MHEIGVGIAVCSPIPMRENSLGQRVLENVTTLWHRHAMQLQFPTNTNRTDAFADGMEVGVARDKVVRDLLKSKRRPRFIFFHDYDVLPAGDAAIKLIFRAMHYPEIDIFAGVYCCKYMSIPDPLIYQEPGNGPFWDWTLGDLLTTEQHNIRGVHMGMTLIRMSLFQRMLDAGIVDDHVPFFKTTVEPGCRGTEDIWFCQLARKVDVKIMVDTSVLCGHQDRETGQVYGLPDNCGPIQRAKWAHRNSLGKSLDRKEVDEQNLKLCIDLGAGENHRQWDGYKTYTLDARSVFTDGTKPDYCQDLLWMNFPNDHWDMVASSHTFEHVARFDQEKLWSEVFRICKPGGKIEIIVPTIEWAAAKIIEGDADEHVLNVLYGAQEEHGYKRELNTHYFGYTKDIGAGLADLAGFTEIKCRDWRDDPNLGYNLVIEAVKPLEQVHPALKDIVPAQVNGEVMGEEPKEKTQRETACDIAEVLRNGRSDEEIEAETKGVVAV